MVDHVDLLDLFNAPENTHSIYVTPLKSIGSDSQNGGRPWRSPPTPPWPILYLLEFGRTQDDPS